MPSSLQTPLLWRRPQPFLRSCHRRFGDYFTVRAAPVGPVVFVAEPDSIKQIFTGDAALFDGGNEVMRLSLGSSSVAVLSGPEHLHTRRRILPMLHGESVSKYEELVRDQARKMIDAWPSGKPFPLFPYTQSLALEVILHAVVYLDDERDRNELRSLIPAILDVGALTELVWIAPWLGRVGPWKRYMETLRRTDDLLFKAIDRRRRDPELERREDILSLLIRSGEDEARDDRWLRDQLMTLILAGHDTTASGLAWTIELLARAPRTLAAARAAAETGDTEYLEAVISEALRLRPVVHHVARTLKKPVTVGPYDLPAGIMVAPAIGLVHGSPRWYPAPEEFRPERFIDGSPAPYTWLPFGGGVRRCPGAAFAIMEMRIALAEMLLRTHLVPASRRPERPRPRHINTIPGRGGRVVLEWRR